MTSLSELTGYRPSETELDMQRLDYDLEDGLISEVEYQERLNVLLAKFDAEQAE